MQARCVAITDLLINVPENVIMVQRFDCECEGSVSSFAWCRLRPKTVVNAQITSHEGNSHLIRCAVIFWAGLGEAC